MAPSIAVGDPLSQTRQFTLISDPKTPRVLDRDCLILFISFLNSLANKSLVCREKQEQQLQPKEAHLRIPSIFDWDRPQDHWKLPLDNDRKCMLR